MTGHMIKESIGPRVLRRAAELIIETGWSADLSVVDSDGMLASLAMHRFPVYEDVDVAAYSVTGAIERAADEIYGGSWSGQLSDGLPDRPAADRVIFATDTALALLAPVLLGPVGTVSGPDHILQMVDEWNNADERTAEEVTSVLLHVANL